MLWLIYYSNAVVLSFGLLKCDLLLLFNFLLKRIFLWTFYLTLYKMLLARASIGLGCIFTSCEWKRRAWCYWWTSGLIKIPSILRALLRFLSVNVLIWRDYRREIYSLLMMMATTTIQVWWGWSPIKLCCSLKLCKLSSISLVDVTISWRILENLVSKVWGLLPNLML